MGRINDKPQTTTRDIPADWSYEVPLERRDPQLETALATVNGA